MAYNEKLADRVREALVDVPNVEEKNMFGGVCFMVNGKMCMGVATDELMCRIGPDREAEALEKQGCRQMDFTGRPMKGYVFVSEDGMEGKKGLDYWVQRCLEFNVLAKSSKKKKMRSRGPRDGTKNKFQPIRCLPERICLPGKRKKFPPERNFLINFSIFESVVLFAEKRFVPQTGVFCPHFVYFN